MNAYRALSPLALHDLRPIYYPRVTPTACGTKTAQVREPKYQNTKAHQTKQKQNPAKPFPHHLPPLHPSPPQLKKSQVP